MYCFQVRPNHITATLQAYLALFVDMPLGEPVTHHFRMEVIQHSLDFTDPAVAGWVNLIVPVVGDEVEQLRIKVVKALVAAEGGTGECDQRTGRECVFGGTLVVWCFIVVRHVVEDGVGR